MPIFKTGRGRAQSNEGESVGNRVRDNVAQCQIVLYKWAVDDDLLDSISKDDFDTLSNTRSYDLSENLIDICTFTKSRASSFGTFAFRLDNSTDWKDIIHPGQWCLIYMTNDGTLPITTNKDDRSLNLAAEDRDNSKLRGICYIERVTSSIDIDDNGSSDIYYEVSGRDFGVIYDETALWFNSFTYDQIILEGLKEALESLPRKTLDEYIRLAHDFFFAPERRPELKSAVAKESGITDLAKQWILPKKMLQDLNVSTEGASFYGNIKGLFDFQRTTFTIPVMPLTSSLQGRAWDKFNEIALTPHFHELFTETDSDGKPKLIYRPIPWGLDQKGYGDLNVPLYKNYAADPKNIVNLETRDVISMNTGRDNHTRYNHFVVTTNADANSHNHSLSLLNNVVSTATGRRFPFQKIQNVRRHGFRPNHAEINTASVGFSGLTVSAHKNAAPDPQLLIKYNELLTDYWQFDLFFETGTFEINGNNDLKLGKILDLAPDLPYNANKVFYVEGYTDTFSIDSNGATSWTQTVNVTRGIEKEALTSGIFQPRRIGRFKDSGSFVKDASFGRSKK